MKKSVKQKFLVLVPHKDVRVKLHNYCEVLVKNGLTGVYRFPLVVPLAALSRSLKQEELKNIAHLLRKTAGNSKINTEGTSTVTFQETGNTLILHGPRLDLELPAGIFDDNLKIKAIYNSLLIGTFLTPDHSLHKLKFDKLSFRAAAVANMYWEPFHENETIIFNWKIGKLSWLPKKAIS